MPRATLTPAKSAAVLCDRPVYPIGYHAGAALSCTGALSDLAATDAEAGALLSRLVRHRQLAAEDLGPVGVEEVESLAVHTASGFDRLAKGQHCFLLGLVRRPRGGARAVRK